MTPWTTYTGDRYIYQGFDAIADALDKAAARDQQQQQFDAQMALERRGQDFRYGMHAEDSARGYYGIDAQMDEAAARLGQQEREMALRFGPERIQPVPLNNAPGYYGIPMTGQVLKPSTPPANPGGGITGTPITDPKGQTLGHVVTLPSGKEQIIRPPAGKQQSILGVDVGAARPDPQRQKLEQEKSRLQKEVGAGNVFPGPDWLGFGTPYAEQLADVSRQLQAMPGGTQPAPVQTPAPGGAQGATPSAPTPRPLDKATAQQLLQQAGGDKERARELARQAGYTF